MYWLRADLFALGDNFGSNAEYVLSAELHELGVGDMFEHTQWHDPWVCDPCLHSQVSYWFVWLQTVPLWNRYFNPCSIDNDVIIFL